MDSISAPQLFTSRPIAEQRRFALTDTRHLTKIDLLSETRAYEPARVPHERPAHGSRALSVVVNVLLGFVRVVPDHLLFESAALLVVLSARRTSARTIPSSV